MQFPSDDVSPSPQNGAAPDPRATSGANRFNGLRPENDTRRKVRAWFSIGILIVLLTLAYADRSALAVGATEIRTDFHLSPAAYGAISSVFAWPYAVSLLVVGGFVDRWGSRTLLSLGTLLFSVSQLCMGFVTGIWQFFVLRVLLGVGEAPGFTSAARATKMWFLPREQGLPTGMWNSASAIGPAVAPLLFTPLMLALGWRGMFVTLGVIGFVLAVAWFAYYRERVPVGTQGPGEAAGAEAPGRRAWGSDQHRLNLAEWGKIFRHPSARYLAVGSFLGGYMGFTLITWLPQYFETSRRVSVAETGVLASLPYFAGIFGAVLGGRFPDFFTRRGLGRIVSCKIGLAGGALMSALVMIPAILSSNLVVATVFLTLSGFFGSFSSSNAWTTVAAVSPVTRVGSVGGIWDFGGFLGSALGPVVTGVLVQTTGSFVPPLLVGVVGVLGSSAAYWFGIKGAVPDPERPAAGAPGPALA